MIDPELDRAVSDAFQRHFGGFATGFVVIVQGVDVDGDQRLEWFHSEGTKTWHMRGWLHEAMDWQLAGQTADMLREEED